MAKRESKKVITGVTEQQYLDAMSSYAIADAQQEKEKATLEIRLAALRERYAPRIAATEEIKARELELIMAYCTENKKVLFSGKRHIENIYGKVGFRFGTPKLKLLPKIKWETVLERVKTIMPDFVRKTEEVDKAAILAQRDNEDVAPHLNALGVYVDNDEHFYIELKKEEETVGA